MILPNTKLMQRFLKSIGIVTAVTLGWAAVLVVDARAIEAEKGGQPASKQLAQSSPQATPTPTAPPVGICAPSPEGNSVEVKVKDPENFQSWLSQGDYFLRVKRYQEALMAYQGAIGLNGGEAQGWLGCAMVLQETQQYDRALTALDQVLSITPTSSLGWFQKGMVFKSSDRNDEALAAFDRALQGNGDWGNSSGPADAWVNRGSVLWRLEKPSEAIAAFEKAIELNPEYALAWYNRATALLQEGNYAEAVASYDRAIASQGQWGSLTGPANAWYNRGVALEQLERYAEAIDSYDEALKIIPNHTKARLRLVALRERLATNPQP